MNNLDKIKVWKKMNIWEVSACGIPIYPRAHKSFSLIKSLRDVGDELNLGEKSMETEDNPTETSETETAKAETAKAETSETETSEAETAESESENEEKEKVKSESESENPEAEKSAKFLQEMIVKGFKDALKQVSTERGLVQNEEDEQAKMEKELKQKSIGELAVMSGLFQKPAVVGSSRRF